jgi:hypothetical protein
LRTCDVYKSARHLLLFTPSTYILLIFTRPHANNTCNWMNKLLHVVLFHEHFNDFYSVQPMFPESDSTENLSCSIETEMNAETNSMNAINTPDQGPFTSGAQ